MRSQIVSGAGWMLLFKLVDRVLGLVSTVILARILVPQDFGLVAMAFSVIALIEMATWMSFDVALIQKRDVERVHYDTAWTLNTLLGLGCGAAIALLAYPTALFYEEPRLTALMLVLAAGWAISGAENIGVVDFRRHLDFRREFAFMSARRVLAFALTTALAVTLQTYWALVIGTVVSKLFAVALSYVMHPYRPRPDLRATRELVGFSGWVLTANILNALQMKGSHFVVGRVLGAAPLGSMTIASEIAHLPSSDLIAPINRAVFPGYSRMAQDPQLLRTLYLDVIAVLMLVAVPAAAGIAAVAEPLVRLLLGEKWLEAIPVIQVLSLSAAFLATTSNNVSAFLAVGKPRTITYLSLLRFAILIPLAVVLTHRHGLVGAAFAELVTTVILVAASVPLLFKHLRLSYAGYFSRIWRPLVAAGAMAYAVLATVNSLPKATGSDLALTLAAGVSLGAVLYPAAITALWLIAGRPSGAEVILFRRIQSRAPQGGENALANAEDLDPRKRGSN